MLYNGTNTTVENCAQLAAKQGSFTHFALQNGSFCFGGVNLVKGTSGGAAIACNVSCTGNSSDICGGFMRNDVYSFPEGTGYEYEGCFVDNASRMVPKMLNANTTLYDPNTWTTVFKCAALAKRLGYTLFALQVRADQGPQSTAFIIFTQCFSVLPRPLFSGWQHLLRRHRHGEGQVLGKVDIFSTMQEPL